MCTEDNELNVEILKELLKIDSAECTIRENGEKILEEIEYYDPDMVTTGLNHLYTRYLKHENNLG